MRLHLFFAIIAAFMLSVSPAAYADTVRTENVETELHASRSAIAPGETFTIVLRQTIREDWHTYWVNPGDSGEATEIEWDLPNGFEAGPIQWPAPQPLPFDILVNYGYSGEVLFPIEITAPDNLPIGQPVTLRANVFWLVCSDICIPEQGELSLELPVEEAPRAQAVWAPRITAALAALPKPSADVVATISPGAPALLRVALPGGAVREPYFFPYSRDALNHAASQDADIDPDSFTLTLSPGVDDTLGQAPLEGVLTLQQRGPNGWEARAYEITAQPAAPPPPSNSISLPVALLFAFLGGLILNIMPCVLPVLSIKALSLAGGVQTGEARRHGLLYLAGVLATFLVLALVLVGLREAGAAVGWGFQLQEPWLVAGLALLFFAIGLNLLGAFEIGGSLQNAGGGLTQRGGDIGAFATGALAVIAATPCTAPFMAGAAGAALTQSTPAVLAIFLMLALGFALPLVALSFAPALQRLIPKPGPWMERFKNVLAFPMFATAILLAWVVTEQTGSAGGLALLALILALGFLVFVARWGRAWTIAGVIVLALTALVAWRPLFPAASAASDEARLQSEPWSPARLTEVRGENRAVFVNFTAAWCVTCKVNEGVALSSPRIAEAFVSANVVYLKGDWTNRDADIAAALAAHGRAGVPLYLYYAPGAETPVILPQLLSESLVLETIAGEAE